MANETLTEVVISYDIACQWGIHLWKRLRMYPSWMRVNHDGLASYRFLVPKFHLPAHIQKCQTRYSFNFNAKVGRTDGEAIERGWAFINPIASSTREMGPGACQDTLDDHFGDYNWRKTCSLAILLLKRLTDAVPEAEDHKDRHHALTLCMSDTDILAWSTELAAWEQDTNLPNPFETRTKKLSQHAVRGKLADEERLQGTAAFIMHEDVSASHLISLGIDLEENQRQLALALASVGVHSTERQRTQIKIRAGILRRKITSWTNIQELYMPFLPMLRSQIQNDNMATTETPPYRIPLMLPSSLRSNVPCDSRLVIIEWRLRCAQAWDTLDDLREALQLRSHILIDKQLSKRGQIAHTRANERLSQAHAKVSAIANRYREARNAIFKLALHEDTPPVDLSISFPELRPSDVRGLPAQEDNSIRAKKKQRRVPGQHGETRASEGHNKLSWIWTHVSVGEQVQNDLALRDALRIEWCKSKARQDRWAEEVQLLQEEMRRLKATFQYQSDMWAMRSQDLSTWSLPNLVHDPIFDEGRRAFAKEQQHQFNKMFMHCEHLWVNVEEFVRNGGATNSIPENPERSYAEDND